MNSTLGKARGANTAHGGHDEREQTLNQLLVEMDGFDSRKGVCIPLPRIGQKFWIPLSSVLAVLIVRCWSIGPI